jgi:hypothetical protein
VSARASSSDRSRLAQGRQLCAGGAEQRVHRPGDRRGLDQAQQHLGLVEPAFGRPAPPGLGEGLGQPGPRLAQRRRRRGGRGLDDEDADHLVAGDQRFPVRGGHPVLGELVGQQPGVPLADDQRESLLGHRPEEG